MSSVGVVERVRRVDPERLDAAFAIALALASLLALWLTPSGLGGRTPDVLSNVLVVAMSLPLAVRRRHPVGVLVTVGCATVVYAATGPFGSLGLGVLYALYSVAVYAERAQSVRSLAWTLAGIGVSFLGAMMWSPGLPAPVALTQVATAWITFGVAWLLGDLVRTRGEAVVTLQARNAELEAERGENARLAVEGERARIARELHDAVAHNVSVMVVQATAARRMLEASGYETDGDVHDALAAIESTGRASLGEMRLVVGSLRPTGDEANVPQPSLAGLDGLLETIRRSGLDVDLVVEGDARALPQGIDLSAYRVVQEALTNTLKHAAAGAAHVRLRYAPDALEVEVTDDGRGAAARLLETPHHGYGLVGMRERVAMLGGDLQAGPRPGGGFGVLARLPLGAPA